MQKKFLALAVAGLFAAPVAAMAQSSVTISGTFKVGVDQYKISNPSAARLGLNTSETRVTDNSSKIIFGIAEDMGGGTAGIAQVDMRATMDAGTLAASGNTWVGIRGSSWGTLTIGRHDLHYGKQPDDLASKGALEAAATSLMDYNFLGGAIANATRTPNAIRYDSPNWSGFAFTAAYSTSPIQAVESDLASSVRKGNGYTINPSYTASNFAVGYSYWRAQGDATGAVGQNQTSNVLYGYWTGGGFKVGAAVNKSKTETVGAAGTAPQSDRTNWTIPVSWTSGPHNVFAHYTRAGKDKVGTAGTTDNTDAKMYAVAYAYDLSKRTSLAVTYAKLDNGTNAKYNFFTEAALGSTGSVLAAGEDAQLIQFTVRHAF